MPTTRRQPRHRSKEQWCQLVDQHAMSGLTIVAFCKAQNIEPKYFSNRRLQLGYLPIKHVKKVKPMVEQPFVAVKLNNSEPLPRERLELKLNAVELSLPTSTSPQWLSSLLRALS